MQLITGTQTKLIDFSFSLNQRETKALQNKSYKKKKKEIFTWSHSNSSAKIMIMYFFFFQKAALTTWDMPVCFSKVSPLTIPSFLNSFIHFSFFSEMLDPREITGQYPLLIIINLNQIQMSK